MLEKEVFLHTSFFSLVQSSGNYERFCVDGEQGGRE